MRRFPRLYDKGSIKRTGIAVGGLVLVAGVLYWYLPLRYDLIERKPRKPLPRIPVEKTGLFESGKKIVIIMAHPDDEAFYLGGTLYRLKESGAEVSLIVMTDGDKAYYPFFDSEPLRKTRREETKKVAEMVGIKEIVFLGYMDGRLSFEEGPTQRLSEELKRLNPDLVLAFDPYYWLRASHRDHRTAGENSQAALKSIGFTGWALYFSTVASNTFSEVDKTWSDAQKLLAVHQSQFFGEKLERIRGMVSERASDAGDEFGVGFAEPIRAVWFEKGKED